MPAGPDIILTLKVLVAAVTVLFAASVAAIAAGRRRLHGRLNAAFLVLTLTTVVGFEGLLRLGADVTAGFGPADRRMLFVHLCFAGPAAVVLPVQYWAGATGRGRLHRPLAVIFTVLWAGTAATGIGFLPHR
jgi:uncharacterized membrane protein YozB (DUF420 family)